jgi:polyphenol oxidase
MTRAETDVRAVEDEVRWGGLPLMARSDWRQAFPWLVQGVTQRQVRPGESFDLRLRGTAPAESVLPRWERLREALGMTMVVHSRQVHGAAVRVARGGGAGILLAPECDGHLAAEPGLLLAVSVADCVPVFMVDPETRAIGLLHAGWRGVAAGILEAGVEAMWDRFGVPAERLHLHLGPAISAGEYEVGPEVHEALGLAVPDGPETLDLRRHLVERAARLGVPDAQVARSAICVRRDDRFFSHRGGDKGRQAAILGRKGD